LAAIVSNNSKATAPTTTYAFMWWADTANDILKQRNAADSAWINILTLSTGAPLGALAASLVSGTHTNFTSTGIDDNATSTAITIDANEKVNIASSDGKLTLTCSIGTGNAYTFKSSGANANFIELSDSANGQRLDLIGGGSTGYRALYTNGLERMRIDSSGKVMINTTSTFGSAHLNIAPVLSIAPAIAIQPATDNYSSGIMAFKNYSGTNVGYIAISDSNTVYATTSDYRLKENVVPMTGSIDRLKDLKPSRFNFKADTDKTVDGFLAHEAQAIVPEAVTGTKDAMMDEEYEVTPAVMDGDTVVTEAVMGTRSVPDYQGIDQSKLVPLLVASLQEAIARIEVLENA